MRSAISIALLLTLSACQPVTPPAGTTAPSSTPVTEEDKTLYALGLSIGSSISMFQLNPHDLDMVLAGISDSILGRKPACDLNVYGPKIESLAATRSAAGATEEKTKGTDFLAQGAALPGAVRLPSGVVYIEERAGTGASPVATDMVKVNYAGTLRDGTEFDSSYKRNEPTSFPLGGVIPCWTEGLQKMKVGGKATLYCPPDTAYGDDAPPPIPAGATLKFEVELLEIGGE